MDSASPKRRLIVEAPAAGLFACEWSLACDGEIPLGEAAGVGVVCLEEGMGKWVTGLRESVPLVAGQGLLVTGASCTRARFQSIGDARVVLWLCALESLPPPLRIWVERATAGGLAASFTLTPSVESVLAGALACPVPASLREHWAQAKLLELLTLVLGQVSPRADHAKPVHHPAIQAALAFMRTSLGAEVTLESIAAAASASASHISRLFTAEFGCGPTHYLRGMRMDEAARMLREGRVNVTEVALELGYASLAQFSRAFRAHHGRNPSAFIPRRGLR